MSLDTNVISQYYSGILRLTPTTAIINNYATFPTYAAVIESMETTAISTVDPIIRLYQAAFGRVPDSNGLTWWVNNYTGGGAGGKFTLDDAAGGFVASAEFQAQYGSLSNVQYVGALYTNILNRAGDSEGIEFWTNQLNSGKLNRAQVLNAFAQSPEFFDLAYDHVKAFETSCALGTETYTGSLFDQGVDPTQYLTVNRDNIIVDGSVANTVFGVIGGTDTTDTNVGTYTLGDNIQGNTLTTVDLVVAGTNTPYVTMSGVDALSFNNQLPNGSSPVTTTLAGANFGTDVSTVSASGTGTSTISVTGLNTNGTFTVNTSAGYAGALHVGDAQHLDPNYQWNPASPATVNYVPVGAVQTTLFGRTAADGAQVNVYETNGSNSVVLTDVVGGADTVNVVAGDGLGLNDEASVALFHVVHGSDDLIVAKELVVGSVTDTINKNATSHVYIDNRATKDAGTPGAARSDSINVAAVNTTIGDKGTFSLDVGSVAQTFAHYGTTIPGNATTRDINIGAVAVTGVEQAKSTINVYNVAKPEDGSDGVVGNISIASITETATRGAGNASVQVVNVVSENQDGVGTAATGNATVGNLTVGNVTMTGWTDADLKLKNIVVSDPTGTSTGDSTIGALAAGNVTLSGVGASFDVDTGNNGTSGGTVTVGNLSVGNVSLTGTSTTATANGLFVGSPYVASLNIQQDAISADESASVGSVTVGNVVSTATTGTAGARIGNRATVNTNTTAANTATVGATAVGNLSATTGNAILATGSIANYNAVANVILDAIATTAGTGAVDTATVGAVTAGNLSATAGNAYDATHGAIANVLVEARAVAPDASLGTASVGNVTLGNLSSVVGNGATNTGTESANANVGVTVHASGSGTTQTSVGAVAIGNVTETGGNDSNLLAAVRIGVGDSPYDTPSTDSIGAVSIGNFTLTGGNSSFKDAETEVRELVSVRANSVGSVVVGTSAITGGTSSDVAVNTIVNARNGDIGTVSIGNVTEVSGTNGSATTTVNVTATEGNISSVVLGNITETVGVTGTVTPTVATTQTASLAINVTNTGVLSDFTGHDIGTVTVGDIALNLPSVTRQLSSGAPVYQAATLGVTVAANDLGTINSVDLGNVSINGGWGVQAAGAGITVLAQDNIGAVNIDSSSVVVGNEGRFGATASDINITAANLISAVTIGDVTRTVGAYQYTAPAAGQQTDITVAAARVGNVSFGDVALTGGTDAINTVTITDHATGTGTTGLLGALTVGDISVNAGATDSYASSGATTWTPVATAQVNYINDGTNLSSGVTIGNVAVNTANGTVATADIHVQAAQLVSNALTVGDVALNFAGTGDARFTADVLTTSTNGADIIFGDISVTGVNTNSLTTTGFTLTTTGAATAGTTMLFGDISVSGTADSAGHATDLFSGSTASWFTIDNRFTTTTVKPAVGDIDYSGYTSGATVTIDVAGTTAGAVAMDGAFNIDGAQSVTVIYDNATTNAITLHDAAGADTIYFNINNANSAANTIDTVTGWSQGVGHQDLAVVTTAGAGGSVAVSEVVSSDYNQMVAAATTWLNSGGHTDDVYLGTINGTGNSYAFYLNAGAGTPLTGIEFVGVALLSASDFTVV